MIVRFAAKNVDDDKTSNENYEIRISYQRGLIISLVGYIFKYEICFSIHAQVGRLVSNEVTRKIEMIRMIT